MICINCIENDPLSQIMTLLFIMFMQCIVLFICIQGVIYIHMHPIGQCCSYVMVLESTWDGMRSWVAILLRMVSLCLDMIMVRCWSIQPVSVGFAHGLVSTLNPMFYSH